MNDKNHSRVRFACSPVVASVVVLPDRWEKKMHRRSLEIIASVGLALGGALGMAGAMVTQQNVQAILWAIDGAGLVMAAALLATKYLRAGNDVVAGGFLVFAIGEGVILLSAPAAGLAGSIPAFAAGTALWATALLLISAPRLFAMPIRRSEEHTSELQSLRHLVCRLLLEKK